MPTKFEKKREYFERLGALLDSHTKIFIVHCDHVGSKQMQDIRKSLRGHATLIMGKNTMMKKVLNQKIKENPKLESLIPVVKSNVGLIFTDGELSEMRDLITSNRVPAAARTGVIAPVAVMVPAGPTGMEPGMTSFFQALNIPTKIAKGSIEILNDVNLIQPGEKVGSSEVALLQKLDIKPFTYGLEIMNVYDDGSVFEPSVLDITDQDLLAFFAAGVRNLASVGLAIGYPTLASLPHSFANAFKNLLAVACECENVTFEKAEKYKEYLKDPAAFAAANPGAAAAAAPAAEEEAAPAAAAAEEEEESDEEMGMGLFGDDSD